MMDNILFKIEKGFLHYKIYKKDLEYDVWLLIGTASTIPKAKEKIQKYMMKNVDFNKVKE